MPAPGARSERSLTGWADLHIRGQSKETNVKRIRLIHWKAEEAVERAGLLQDAGYRVDASPYAQGALRAMRDDPPAVVVIDLTRLPSQGRDVAVSIRMLKATRHLPLVFAGGAPSKVERIRELLPDAAYASWEAIPAAIAEAIAHTPQNPVVPASVMEAYRGTPLPKKLGLKPHTILRLVGAPPGFESTLKDLPEGVSIVREGQAEDGITLWFVRSSEELVQGLPAHLAAAARGGLWILWPKKASGVESDLSQQVVRREGLAAGLVDFKVCSVDVTWSGLRFTQRQAKPD